MRAAGKSRCSSSSTRSEPRPRKWICSLAHFGHAPGTFSALLDLTTELSKKKGTKALISSVGCKSKKHDIGVSVGYVPNPNPPAQSSASGTASAKCS